MAGRQAGQPHLSLQRALNKSLRNEITVGTLHLLSPFLPYKILNVFGVVVCFVSQQNSEGQQIFCPIISSSARNQSALLLLLHWWPGSNGKF